MFRPVALGRGMREQLYPHGRSPSRPDLRSNSRAYRRDLAGQARPVLRINRQERFRWRTATRHLSLSALLGHDDLNEQPFLTRWSRCFINKGEGVVKDKDILFAA
jgi:hypothetical protein